ncbi:MAG: DUF2752 domain-containing protein [Aestuariibaculum sp.]
MLPCLSKKLLGFDCLGCGLQRAFALLLKGEFTEAFYMYPAIYTLVPLAFVISFNLFYKLEYTKKIINILAITSVTIIITSFIIKRIIY